VKRGIEEKSGNQQTKKCILIEYQFKDNVGPNINEA